MDSLHFEPISGKEAHAEFVALLNSCFPVPRGHSFLEDFPVWGVLEPDTHFYIGGYSSGRLVAAAAARTAELITEGAPLPIGLIGAVATHSSCRGRGFASQATAQVLDWLARRRVALAVLWGSEHELYRRMGFELCGIQTTLPLWQLQLPSDAPRPGRGWVPGLWERLKRRGSGLQYGEKDRSWLEAHANVQWYWLGEPSKPTAYAALGRGIDLGGLVHEWGGDPEALRSLLSAVRAEVPGAALLGSPRLFEKFRLVCSPGTPVPEEQFLCMARFMALSEDPERVYSLLGEKGASPLWFWGLDGA
ncbi:MAG: GNAT family N-acetyltransferase [Oligoflexia bacterium]|nr:GNAT family N-acetyltransferase [Oligoflexia bacterium]